MPDKIRTTPPSIWSPPKVSPHSKQKVHREMLRDFRQSESVMLRLLSKYDTDNDGFIDERELRNLLSDMSDAGIASMTLDEKLVRTLLNAIDSDGSGKVSTDELIRAWRGWLGRALLPTRCLLMIDVQNDFIGGSLAVTGAEKVVPIINELRRKLAFDVVAYSMDWHPYNHCSFFETFRDRAHGSRPSEVHPEHPPDQKAIHEAPTMFSMVTLTAPTGAPMSQVLWPRHCVQGTWGAENHEDLETMPTDVFVLKGTDASIDSYSAFFDNMKFKATGLVDELNARRVSHLYLVGIAFDYCVCHSALHSASEGFVVTVVEDATAAVAPDSTARARAMLTEAGVRICTSKELPALMNADVLNEVLAAATAVTRARDVTLRTMLSDAANGHGGHAPSTSKGR